MGGGGPSRGVGVWFRVCAWFGAWACRVCGRAGERAVLRLCAPQSPCEFSVCLSRFSRRPLASQALHERRGEGTSAAPDSPFPPTPQRTSPSTLATSAPRRTSRDSRLTSFRTANTSPRPAAPPWRCVCVCVCVGCVCALRRVCPRRERRVTHSRTPLPPPTTSPVRDELPPRAAAACERGHGPWRRRRWWWWWWWG